MGEMEDALYEAGPMKRQDSQEFCLLSRCDMISEDFLVSSSTKITNSQIFYGKRADGASSGCWFAPKCVYLPRLYDYDGVLGQNDDTYGVRASTVNRRWGDCCQNLSGLSISYAQLSTVSN